MRVACMSAPHALIVLLRVFFGPRDGCALCRLVRWYASFTFAYENELLSNTLSGFALRCPFTRPFGK